MKNTPSGDIVSSRSKATLITTFTSLCIAVVQTIRNENLRVIVVPATPFVILLLSTAVKTYYKRYKCKKVIKIHQGWIDDLETENNNPTTTAARKKEIAKEIKGYQDEIKKKQIDAIDVDFS